MVIVHHGQRLTGRLCRELILDAGERIDVACDECHEKYQLIEDDPEGNVGRVLGNFKPKPAPKP